MTTDVGASARRLVAGSLQFTPPDAQWIATDQSRDGYLEYLCTTTRSSKSISASWRTSQSSLRFRSPSSRHVAHHRGRMVVVSDGGQVSSLPLPGNLHNSQLIPRWQYRNDEFKLDSDGATAFYQQFAAAQLLSAEKGV